MLGSGPITSPTPDEVLSKRGGRGRRTHRHWTFDVVCSLRRCPVAAEGAGSSLVADHGSKKHGTQEAASRRGGSGSWGTSPFNLHLTTVQSCLF